MSKHAKPDHPIQESLASRWSPYGFDGKTVSGSDLCSLFEAARWAASAFNEQPWSFIAATRDDTDAFDRLLSCLVEPNQAWARNAGALAISVVSRTFSRNGKPNSVALHDIGLAVGNLTFEATARGLHVHQMAGILPDRVRELYAVPEGHDPVTGIAVGYAADPAGLSGDLRQRDEATRERKSLREFVFGEKWGNSSPHVAS